MDWFGVGKKLILKKGKHAKRIIFSFLVDLIFQRLHKLNFRLTNGTVSIYILTKKGERDIVIQPLASSEDMSMIWVVNCITIQHQGLTNIGQN